MDISELKTPPLTGHFYLTSEMRTSHYSGHFSLSRFRGVPPYSNNNTLMQSLFGTLQPVPMMPSFEKFHCTHSNPCSECIYVWCQTRSQTIKTYPWLILREILTVTVERIVADGSHCMCWIFSHKANI